MYERISCSAPCIYRPCSSHNTAQMLMRGVSSEQSRSEGEGCRSRSVMGSDIIWKLSGTHTVTYITMACKSAQNHKKVHKEQAAVSSIWNYEEKNNQINRWDPSKWTLKDYFLQPGSTLGALECFQIKHCLRKEDINTFEHFWKINKYIRKINPKRGFTCETIYFGAFSLSNVSIVDMGQLCDYSKSSRSCDVK